MVQSVSWQQLQADGPLWPEDDELGGDDAAGRAAETAYYADLARIEEAASYQVAAALALADAAGGDWEDCPQCHGRGWEWDSDRAGDLAIRCQCGRCRGTGLGQWVHHGDDDLVAETSRPPALAA